MIKPPQNMLLALKVANSDSKNNYFVPFAKVKSIFPIHMVASNLATVHNNTNDGPTFFSNSIRLFLLLPDKTKERKLTLFFICGHGIEKNRGKHTCT
jgi:hypothetical protein